MGIGGTARHFAESAVGSSRDACGRLIFRYRSKVRVGKLENIADLLPLLLGHGLLHRWWCIVHEPEVGRLEFYATGSDELVR